MAFFQYIDLKFNNLTAQINDYLRSVFNRSDESFSNASPYGQIMNVEKEFYQQNVIYQKNVVRNFMIEEADNQKAIRNLARIGGHNPTRAITATGSIKLKLKSGIDITNEIAGGRIKINDKTKIKNKSNGLIYSIRFGNSQEFFELSQSKDIYLNLVQGTYETYQFTGDGNINQSFSVNISAGNTIDNFDIEVKYNNNSVTIKDAMYDMLRTELACFTRTGMNGGLDIYFGNGDFGFIPEPGVLISVTYLLTDGTNGIILTPQINDFQWIDEIVDMDGNSINIDNTFDVYVDKQIGFASNGETTSFTKALMPYISRNFVLATPSQYIYTLKRLSLFSKINVYNTLDDNNFENDNKIYLFLVPNIKNYYSNNVNYFNVPLDVFTLEQEEIDKTLTYLKKMGNIPVNTVLEVIQPVISKYILNIYVRKFQGYSDDTIKQNIITNISSYLSDLERDDRIPKSDIINILEDIAGVDSVNVSFVSKKNEDFHKIKTTSNQIYGLDPVLGDIIVESQELAIIRGGWSDRNFTYYNETLDGTGLGPINIVFVGVTEQNINNQ
jgi:hypothetical protein